jgi:hypothetical protein
LPAKPVSQHERNGGYYLLHKLSDDESHLPLLLLIKSCPKEVHEFADKISSNAKENMAVLDRIRSHDPSMSYDENPLPQFEQDIRASIKEEKQHQLLFATSGPAFVRALLISQSEATKYGANITKVLAEDEPDPDRAATFRRLSAKWERLYDEDFQMLGEH